MRNFRLAMLGALLASAAAPATAAQSETLLKLLLAKGVITQQEYLELQREAEAMDAAELRTGTPPADPQKAAAFALDDRRMVRMTESGVGFEMGGVTLKFSGSVNGFYVHDNGDDDEGGTAVIGGLATVGDNSSSVRNGLLPGFFKFDVTTNQGGWDIGAHFGLYPGINSVDYVGGANSAGNPAALGTAGIDARQTFLTIGKPKLGEFKIGRDIGLFASEAILNDMTLLGVGTPAGNGAPSNTSLGRIGIGYIYTDFQPQISYSSPKLLGGLQATVGLFQPLRTAGSSELNSSPGFQGKVTYDFGDPKRLNGRLWVSGIIQKHDGTEFYDDYTGKAIDFGAKLGLAGFGLTGQYYTGSGVGTTGLFIFPIDEFGNKRDSSGFYLQGSYSIGKLFLGVSYGESSLDLADGEDNPLLVKKNASWAGQARYALTSWVNLVAEYVHTSSEAHGGNEADSDALAAGAILFF